MQVLLRHVRARPLSARRCVFFTAPPQPLVTTPCAVQPYRAFPRLLLLHALKARSLRLGCRFACFRHTHRSLPFACERFAGSATQPDYCETRPLGVRVAGRYGSRVRLSGTALRYGSQVLLRAASAPVILAHTRAPSSPIPAHLPAHLPSPHRRTTKLIPTPTHAPSTHILSRTRAINFKHLP